MSTSTHMALLLVGLLAFAPVAWAGDDHDHGTKKQEAAEEHDHGAEKHDDHQEKEGKPDDHGHGDEEEHGDTTTISTKVAAESGIATVTAGSATIKQTLLLTGQISLNQNKLAQVKARFPGIVREVRKGTGDAVRAGDVLAMVEANDSLQTYAVKSPLSGIVLARSTNMGDVAGDAPLFQIADLSEVWAEFHIFPKDADRIAVGQTILVHNTNGSVKAEGSIQSLLPVAEASSQTIIARVPLQNAQQNWRSGMIVRGDVVINQKAVPLAVRTTALQRMEGKTVVFVKTGDDYAARPVETGLADTEWTEIRHGLNAGEEYVKTGSFIVKADIGKAGAAHEH